MRNINKQYFIKIIAILQLSLAVVLGNTAQAAQGNFFIEKDAGEVLMQKRAKAFVDAFNSNDAEKAASFTKENWSGAPDAKTIDSIAGLMSALYAEGGSITEYVVKIVNPQALSIISKREKNGNWDSFQFRIDPDDDHKMKLIFIAEATAPVTLPTTAIDDPRTEKWLKNRIAQLASEQPFYGAISITKKGETIFETVAGSESLKPYRRNTIDTKFKIASGGKMFTSVAIGKLVMAGKLSYSDLLVEYLPELKDIESVKNVTVAHLLSHTSGIGDYWDDAFEKEWYKIKNHSDYLPYVIKNIEANELGDYAYSNSNFILLGLIIEKVSGQDYYGFVQKAILDPLKMTNTSYPIFKDAPAPGFAVGLEANSVNGKTNNFDPVVARRLGSQASAAGGVYTTVGDMQKFGQALLSNTLVSPEIFKEMTTPRNNRSGVEGSGYGFGLIMDNTDGYLSYGHGGMGPGSEFRFSVYPKDEIIVVVVSNFSTIATHELNKAIDGMIRTQYKK